MVVHLFGNPADMDPIMELALRHGLVVIEARARAHLALYKGLPVGTIGDLGCFSFQQSKLITTGDGGTVMTNDNRLGERIVMAHNTGRGHAGREGEPPFRAPNYRMTESQAAVGIAQLRRLPAIAEARSRWGTLLSELLQGVPGLITPRVERGSRHVYWRYAPLVDQARISDGPRDLAAALAAEGLPWHGGSIKTPIYGYRMLRERRLFGESALPLHDPATGRDVRYEPALCPNAEAILNRMMTTILNENFTEQIVIDVARGVRKVCEHYAR